MAIAPHGVQNPAYRLGDMLRPARGWTLRAGLQFSGDGSRPGCNFRPRLRVL